MTLRVSLSRSDFAVACVLVSALEAGRLSVESDDARAERLRLGRVRFTAPTPHERDAAREAHAQLDAVERKDRGQVVRLLRSGHVAARPWVLRLESHDVVRGACAMARRGVDAREESVRR